MNPHAHSARLAKVRRLTDCIDRNLTSGTGGFVDAHADAHGIAVALRKWTASEWAQLAVIAGCRPPSTETVEAVIAVYEQRATEPSVEDSGVYQRVAS